MFSNDINLHNFKELEKYAPLALSSPCWDNMFGHPPSSTYLTRPCEDLPSSKGSSSSLISNLRCISSIQLFWGGGAEEHYKVLLVGPPLGSWNATRLSLTILTSLNIFIQIKQKWSRRFVHPNHHGNLISSTWLHFLNHYLYYHLWI